MADQGMKAVQRNNFSETFRLFYEHESLSKKDIAQTLGNSLPTVSTNLTTLLERGLILKDGRFTGARGRRADRYILNPSAFGCVGLEIFREFVSIVLLGANGAVRQQHQLMIDFKNEPGYYKKISQEIRNFVSDSDFDEGEIIGLGVGVQGLVSSDGQEILYGKILNMTGVTTDVFQRYLPYPVYFVHDADAVAITEQHVAKRQADAVYLSIGEHLGTAMMVDGQIYHGTFGSSGTMEHISINSKYGRRCYCGRRGCLETYASISALLHGRTENLDKFFELLNAGDEKALERWNSYLDHLAHTIVNLQMFADNTIVLAGDLARFINQDTLQRLQKRIAKISPFPEIAAHLEIGKADCYVVAEGAGLPYLQAYIDSI